MAGIALFMADGQVVETQKEAKPARADIQPLKFRSVHYDDGGFWAGNGIVVPEGMGGVYRGSVSVAVEKPVPGSTFLVYLLGERKGLDLLLGTDLKTNLHSWRTYFPATVRYFRLEAGDRFDARILQNTGQPLALLGGADATFLALERVANLPDVPVEPTFPDPTKLK